MRTVLITAYAINPYKGSEDGTGWNYVSQIARHNKVIAITRPNNLAPIERYIAENKINFKAVQFIGFDLPYILRFWKKGGRGAMLYFYLWQMAMPLFIKMKGLKFNIAHNLNFHTTVVPTFLYLLGKPTVWGPIGHHPAIPDGYYNKENSTRTQRLKLQLNKLSKYLFWNFDPFNFLARKFCDTVIMISSDVVEKVAVNPLKRVEMFSVGAPAQTHVEKSHSMFNVISVGRMEPLKGFDISIKAYHKFVDELTHEDRANVRLKLVGKGTQLEYLKKYIKENHLEEQVEIIEWIEQQELFKLFKQCHLMLFPSHEGAGMVVPEAFSFRIPVLCFDNCGPGELTGSAGIRVPYTDYEQSVNMFATELKELYQHRKTVLKELSATAFSRFEDHFNWDVKSKKLNIIYDELTSK